MNKSKVGLLLVGKPLKNLMAMRSFQTELLPEGAKAFINGKWTDSMSGKVFEVNDPYNNELLCDVANCDVQDAEMGVAAARQAFEKWGFITTAKERGAILQKWYQIMVQKENQLAEILTREQGKPLAEAKGEIAYSSSFLDWYSAEARRIYGQVVPPPVQNRQHYHVREPIGVVVLITPWNFPSAMLARKAGAALAAGCTIVAKPAEDTPLSALALAQTAKEAGLPEGVFNVLPADRPNTAEISKFLCESTDVDAISFTGSTAVGKILLSQSTSTVKRVCLELGGNAPFIVFDSANVEKAINGLLASKFRCSGQTCVCANRIFVHAKVHDQFVEGIHSAMSKLVLGHGMKKHVTQGPLINQKAVDKVVHLVQDATSKGAKIIMGGKAKEDTTLFEPTILTDITSDMEIAHTEIFGPVVAIQKFESEDEVIKKANDTRYGLAGYFFSENVSQIFRVSRRLHTGMIGINEGIMSCAEAAFGGVKESGLGREGSVQGIDEFTQWKYLCLNTS